MDIEETITEILSKILKGLGVEYKKVVITEDEKDSYLVNIESS